MNFLNFDFKKSKPLTKQNKSNSHKIFQNPLKKPIKKLKNNSNFDEKSISSIKSENKTLLKEFTSNSTYKRKKINTCKNSVKFHNFQKKRNNSKNFNSGINFHKNNLKDEGKKLSLQNLSKFEDNFENNIYSKKKIEGTPPISEFFSAKSVKNKKSFFNKNYMESDFSHSSEKMVNNFKNNLPKEEKSNLRNNNMNLFEIKKLKKKNDNKNFITHKKTDEYEYEKIKESLQKKKNLQIKTNYDSKKNIKTSSIFSKNKILKKDKNIRTSLKKNLELSLISSNAKKMINPIINEKRDKFQKNSLRSLKNSVRSMKNKSKEKRNYRILDSKSKMMNNNNYKDIFEDKSMLDKSPFELEKILFQKTKKLQKLKNLNFKFKLENNNNLRNVIFKKKKEIQFLEEKNFNLKNEKRVLNEEIFSLNEKMSNENKNLKKINFFGIENKSLKNQKIEELKKIKNKNVQFQKELDQYYFLNKNKFLKRQNNCEKNLEIELQTNSINIQNYDEDLIKWLNYYINQFK